MHVCRYRVLVVMGRVSRGVTAQDQSKRCVCMGEYKFKLIGTIVTCNILT